jgi:hypothetical protein
MDAVRRAVAAGDCKALRLASHTLKGSIRLFGGTAVYAGVTWNIGRIWRSSSHASRHLPAPTPK